MTVARRAAVPPAVAFAAMLILPAVLSAADPVRLREPFAAGQQYHVSCRVELSGSLTPEAEPGKPAPKPLTLTGESAIEYDERILAAESNGEVRKTARVYRRIDFQRKVGDKAQQTTIRPAVRRLVLLRHKSTEVPFSPDGPLTWGEIDLVRTDVFTPALAGLLADKAVSVGERWTASTGAVQELTDMEQIDEGRVECKLEQLTQLPQAGQDRRHARVSFAGSVRGVGEDGPSRQQLEGYFYFDLESNHLSYLFLKGTHLLLDKQGKEVGRVEGRFVLTRQAQQKSADLADEALRGWVLEPNADNTLLLYDDPGLGLRFLYPRRWRAAGRGQQVTLDAPDGSGLLLTVEPPSGVPTGAQYLAETRDWLAGQKAKVLRIDPVRPLQGGPDVIERFGLDVEVAGQKAAMDYYVVRQKAGGVTVAARLQGGELDALRREVEQIVRTISRK